jgi:hypothetical protein
MNASNELSRVTFSNQKHQHCEEFGSGTAATRIIIPSMNRSIREHVALIASAIDKLEAELPTLKDPAETLKTEGDLRSLRLALMHYELALEIEREVIESRSARGVSIHVA